MGKYDEERQKLRQSGLVSPVSTSTTDSKYATERDSLINPQKREAFVRNQYAEAMKPSRMMEIDSINKKKEEERETRRDMAVKGIDHAGLLRNANNLSNQLKSTVGGLSERPPYLDRVKSKVNEAPAIVRPLLAPLVAIGEAPAVRAIGEALGTDNPEEKGLMPVSGVGKTVGEIVAPIGAALTVPGGNLGGGALYRQAGNVMGRYAPWLSNSAGGRIINEATKSGGIGVPLGVGTTLALNPEATGKELAESAVMGAATGTLFGGVLKGSGELLKGAAKKAGDDIAKNVFNSVSSLDRANNAPQYGSKLKLDNKGQNVSRIMDSIREDVNKAMTPPLENEKALREWVKPILGNPSNKELAKMSYNDLVEIADEARKGMNVYDTALEVAKRKGINLEQAFESAPSIHSAAAQDASKRAYGIYPDNLPNVSRPLSKSVTEASEEAASNVNQHWFTRLFGDQGLGISPFGSNNPISRNPLTTEEQIVRNPLKNSVEGVGNQAKAMGRGFYQSQVDMYSPLKHISKETYDTAMDSARANNIANTIVRDKFVDAQGNVIGDSLRDTLQKIGRGNDSKFKDYLVLRHAKTRMERGENVYAESLNMNPDKIQERINMYESRYPGFKEIGKEWDNFNDNMLQTYGVDEGLISQEMKDMLRQQNPHYTSMRRQFTTAEKIANPAFRTNTSGFSGQKAPIKEVSKTGSTRRIVDPTRSAIEQTRAWVNASLRNRTMQEIVKSVQRSPEEMKDIVEIVQPPKGQKSLKDILSDGGSEDFIESLNSDFDNLFKRGRLDQDNVVRAMVKGEPVYVKVHNPEAVKALLGSGSEQSNIILDVFRSLSNLTKKGATGALAPFFSIKSLTGDVIQSAIQAKNPLQHLAVDVPHAVLSSIADVLKIPGLRNLAQDYRRVGGGYSGIMRDERALNKSVRGLTKQPILSGRNIAGSALTAVKSPFKVLEGIADVTENIPRMAAYKRNIQGLERTPENIRNAVNASREATVNFTRKGTSSKALEAVFPYHNAAVQSMKRFATNWTKNPIKTAAMVTTAIILPKLYEYSKFADDPDYQKLPARERYRNLIYAKNADGTFKKMKMPMEYEALGGLFVDTLRTVKDEDHQAFKGAADAVVSAFSPPALGGALQGITQGGGLEQSIKGAQNSSIIAPYTAVTGNQSFTGAPIVPKRLQGESVNKQFDERTSNIAKKIGEKLGMAPLKVDYLLRAYGGDPARLLLPLDSPYGGGEVKNTLLKNFIVDPVLTNNLSDDFYTAKDKFRQAKSNYVNNGDPLPSWYSANVDDLLNSQKKNSPSKILSALNDEKRSITGDKTLSAKSKADKLREIQANINQIYTSVNAEVMKTGFKFPNR